MSPKQTLSAIAVALGLSLLIIGSGQAQEPPPQGFIPGADDYLCYRTLGEDLETTVRLSDQFDGLGELETNEPGDPRKREIRRAQWHCNPVRKRILDGPNEGFIQPINHPEIHYVCHEVRPHKNPNVEVHVEHEFGGEDLKIKREAFLCSPAKKEIIRTHSD